MIKNAIVSAAENITEVTIEQLESTIEQLDNSILVDEIKRTADILKTKVNEFDNNKLTNKYNKNNLSPESIQDMLEYKINEIYRYFFALQNLILQYMNQKVVITYVHINSNGQREIRLIDNDIKHLAVEQGHNFYKIGYDVQDNYMKLRNSLPDTTNTKLQQVAKLAEDRYKQFKKVVWWKIRGQKWAGYQFYTKGPINEAFANFYINTRPGINYFRYSLEKNLSIFITHPKFGAIQADYLNGFLLGDVTKGNIQFAVKGQFGSPQGFKQVVNFLNKIGDDFNEKKLQQLIKYFTKIPKNKTSQIKQLQQDEIEHIIQPILNNLKST